MSLIHKIEDNLKDCEKSYQYYKYHRDRKIKKFEKKVTGLYLQDKIYVSHQTFMNSHFVGTPSMARVLDNIRRVQINSGKPMVRIDDRKMKSLTGKPYARSTLQKAYKDLEEANYLVRIGPEHFDDMKKNFDLPLNEPCRLLRVVLPDYVQVKNDKKNSLERNMRSIVGAEYGLRPQEVGMKEIWDFILKNKHLKNSQRKEGVRFCGHHIGYSIFYNSFMRFGINSSTPNKNSLKYFPFKKNERIIKSEMPKTEQSSSLADGTDVFLSLRKFSRHGKKNSFGNVSDYNQTHQLKHDDIVKDYPQNLEFRCYEEVVRFLHEDLFLKEVPLSHVWVMALCAGYAAMFQDLLQEGDGYQLYLSCWERVMFNDKPLSKVIGMDDCRVRYIEEKLITGGKFGTIPDYEQLPLGSILQESSQELELKNSGGEEVGGVQKVKSGRLARMENHERNSLVGVTTRRHRAEIESSERKLQKQLESEAPNKKKTDSLIISKTQKQVRHFTHTFDFETGGDPNLTERGIFMRYLLAIKDEASHEKWHKSWKWHVVKDFYHREMRKIHGAGFISDVIPTSQNDKKFVRTVGNVKRAMESFNFVKYMEMLYFCIHNPEPLYFYNFFNQDFRLCKLTNYERLVKVEGIMSRECYWHDRYLRHEDYDTLLKTDEAVAEDRKEAEERLSAEDRAELFRLEKEVNASSQVALELDCELGDLEEREILLKVYLRAYNKNIGYLGDEQKAKEHTFKAYKDRGDDVPEVSEAQRELVELRDKIQELELKVANIGNISAKNARIKELLSER